MTRERERCELTLTCWLIVIACVASSSARFHNLDELVLLNTEAGAPRAHQSGGSQPDAEGIAGKLLASAPDVMKLFRAQDSSARSWPGVDSLPPIPRIFSDRKEIKLKPTLKLSVDEFTYSFPPRKI
jgi:hypothetical protein